MNSNHFLLQDYRGMGWHRHPGTPVERDLAQSRQGSPTHSLTLTHVSRNTQTRSPPGLLA